MDNKTYVAIVQTIVKNGKHGPYAVVQLDELGFVTFSLKEEVWTEKKFPELGSYVVLSDITKKRGGWRADHGRFLQPSDNQPLTQKARRRE